jgi:hypothetical protein
LPFLFHADLLLRLLLVMGMLAGAIFPVTLFVTWAMWRLGVFDYRAERD